MHYRLALSLVYAVSALAAAASGLAVWRLRRTVPAASALIIAAAGLFGWCVAYSLVMVAPLDLRLGLTAAAYLGVDVAVAGFFCMCVATTDPQWAPSRSLVMLLGVKPVTSLLIAVTNPYHHLLLSPTGPGTWEPRTLFWTHTYYNYLFLMLAALVLLRGWIFGGRQQRLQIAEISVAMTLPLVINIMLLRGLIRGEADLTPVGTAMTAGVWSHAVLTRGALRIAPIAREIVLEWIDDAVLMVSPDGRVSDVNPAAETLYRRCNPQATGPLIGMFAEDLLRDPVESFGPSGREHHVVTPDGWVDLDVRVTPLPRQRGLGGGWVVVSRDVTELADRRREVASVVEQLREQVTANERLRAELAEQARRDPLTGLHNRRHLGERLGALLGAGVSDDDDGGADGSASGVRACACTCVGAILLDVDHFKQVNDVHGHGVGDDLLVAVARELASGLPPDAVLVRYGGEEFVLLLPGWSLERTAELAESVRARCAQVTVTDRDGRLVGCTISAGVAAYPDVATTGDRLLAAADDALYQAKERGRDRVVTCSAPLTTPSEVFRARLK